MFYYCVSKWNHDTANFLTVCLLTLLLANTRYLTSQLSCKQLPRSCTTALSSLTLVQPDRCNTVIMVVVNVVYVHLCNCLDLFDPSVCRLNTMAAAPPLRRTDSARGEFSPLKRFVVAKKKISDVFEQLLNYVKETSEFVEGERVCFSVLNLQKYIYSSILLFEEPVLHLSISMLWYSLLLLHYILEAYLVLLTPLHLFEKTRVTIYFTD